MEPVLVEQFFLGCLAHASYLVGSEGIAAVIDPQRDVDIYIDAARQKSLKIRPDDGAFIVVDGVTTIQGAREGRAQGKGTQVFHLQEEKRSTQCNTQTLSLQH